MTSLAMTGRTHRTAQRCRSEVEQVLKESTKSGIATAESRYGVRYSILLELPYFDPVRHTAIDMMHNLFLGTGKWMFGVWIGNGVTKESIEESYLPF